MRPRRGQWERGRFADTALFPGIDPVTLRLRTLVQLEEARADRLVKRTIERDRRVAIIRWSVLAVMLLAFAWAARRILRHADHSVAALTGLASSIERGDFDATPPRRPPGEPGVVMDAMLRMRAELARSRRELAASEAKARQASLAKSNFVATMSHEIRTPLIGVTGMLEVLSHSRLDIEQRGVVQVVQQSAAALLQIVGDVLDFSKIEADRLTIDPQPTDLAGLVRETTSNFEAAASERGLLLDMQVDGALQPGYRVDALRLRQILVNLISNALKFTAQGGVTVRVADAAGTLRVEVVDTGIGIAVDKQAQLFAPFQQADDGTTRRYGGTGLGLAISRQLARLMGGDLTLESAPGEGTTMRLTLPAEACALPPQSPRERALEPVRSAPPRDVARRQGRLVLVVDDHPTNRLVIARQLALAGYACDTAADGDAALALWRDGGYGLLLTDLHMPNMDGYALARAVRDDEARRRLSRAPIVALTAAVMAEDIARCERAGIDRHLAKPASVPQLIDVLDTLLGPPSPDVGAVAPASTVTDALPPTPVPTPSPLPIMPRPGPVPVLDETTLAALAPTPAERAVLLEEFLASCNDDMAALRTALVGEPTEAHRHAHRLKGAARLVGALPLADAAGAVEQALRTGGEINLEALADALIALRAAVSGPTAT